MLQNELGYCPQQHALIDVLTGKELLTIFAELRGVKNPSQVADNFLKYFSNYCIKSILTLILITVIYRHAKYCR